MHSTHFAIYYYCIVGMPWIGHMSLISRTRYFAQKALSTDCTARNMHSNCTGLTPDENVWKNKKFTVRKKRLIEEVKKTEISPKILMQYQCIPKIVIYNTVFNATPFTCFVNTK